MTVAELEKIRPNVKPHAYFGLSESVGEDQVWYGLGELYRASEGAFKVEKNMRVTTVLSPWQPATDEEANAKWARLHSKLTAAAKKQPLCVSWGSRPNRGRIAFWRIGSSYIKMRQQYADSADELGHKRSVGPELSLQISSDSSRIISTSAVDPELCDLGQKITEVRI